MPIYYFGYGSNMSQQMMRDWCPSFKLMGRACLEDWTLRFTRFSERWGAGVADIVISDGETAWGGLYEMTLHDLSALDRKEGNGKHYQRIEVNVMYEGLSYRAYTYEVINKSDQLIPTSRQYRDTMLTGARELNLPQDYIRRIEALPITED